MATARRSKGLSLGLVALLAAAASACVGACIWPVQPSPDCKRKMSDCQAACAEDPQRSSDGLSQDNRTTCQQRCDQICE